MKYIELTKDKVSIVDDDDYEIFGKLKWFANKDSRSNNYYAMRTVRENGKIIRRSILAREISKCPEGYIVDHKNHDTLDNRKENLRVCSPRENNRNRQIGVDNTSGYKGVGKHGINKWRSYIRDSDGSLVYLGTYDDKVSAAIAYDNKAKQLFGEFAHTNF